jgi:hypothetical protein
MSPDLGVVINSSDDMTHNSTGSIFPSQFEFSSVQFGTGIDNQVRILGDVNPVGFHSNLSLLANSNHDSTQTRTLINLASDSLLISTQSQYDDAGTGTDHDTAKIYAISKGGEIYLSSLHQQHNDQDTSKTILEVNPNYVQISRYAAPIDSFSSINPKFIIHTDSSDADANNIAWFNGDTLVRGHFGGSTLFALSGTNTATGTVIGELNGNLLQATQNTTIFFQVSGQAGEENARMLPQSTEIGGAYTDISAYSNNDNGYRFDLIANNVTNTVSILGDAPTNTITYTAESNKFNGSIVLPYVPETGTYNVLASDYSVECTSGTFTVTLPTAASIAGKQYFITNSGSGVITLATTSSQTFVNQATTPTSLTIAQFGGYLVESNGANWIVVSKF